MFMDPFCLSIKFWKFLRESEFEDNSLKFAASKNTDHRSWEPVDIVYIIYIIISELTNFIHKT